jgi:pyruvate,water dikinase
MYESVLGVTDADSLVSAIGRCRASAEASRVTAYIAEHGLSTTPMAVIIQEMVEGDASGVMFTSDPSDPDWSLISAAWGLGEGVVQGTVPCDTTRVSLAGVVESDIVKKDQAISMVDGEPTEVPVPETMQHEPALSELQAKTLAKMGRGLEAELGTPQDIEWTRQGDRIILLQARPITQKMPKGRRLIWDNSNIIESYHGLTSPLTYSFANHAYTIVYQLFCRVMGVRPSVIQQHSSVFPMMIGLIRGRIYYNLDAWYTVVALLPGYKWNREFMEQMMGVSQVASPVDVAPSSRLQALPSLVRSIAGLAWRAFRLDADIDGFTRRFEAAMSAHPRELRHVSPMDLLDIYSELERKLLWSWSTPIVNDFFVMIFHGTLRSLCQKWIDGEEGLHNSLLAGEGGLLSAAPAVDGLKLANEIRARTEWRVLFDSDLSDSDVYRASSEIGSLRLALDEYLEKWGDRCADELKLEVPTWRHRPGLLVGTLRGYLMAPPGAHDEAESMDLTMRVKAEERAFGPLSGFRARVFRWVLSRTRQRVRDRENLRFLRTRVFARVREIFLALGTHMVSEGALLRTRDVFWLTTDEVFGWVRGTTVTTDLQGLVKLRQAEYGRWRESPEPGDRFRTWGPVWANNSFFGAKTAPSTTGLRGLAACPGIVEGRVVRVTDPHQPGDIDGAIMVAYRTDPGWVSLFPRVSAIVVERGSLLSHSAVVAREMGIPSIVAVSGVMDALKTGDRVRVDAVNGEIEIVEQTL